MEKSIEQFTINNGVLSLTALDFGAIIHRLIYRDKNGNPFNVVVSLKDPLAYLSDQISLGATVGRFAGRISGGQITIDGQLYPLYSQKGVHLHGGREGFAKKTWDVKREEDHLGPRLEFTYSSPHLEEGYPGQLDVTVVYALIENSLHIEHRAVTDRTTVVNLTNHSYFRLDEKPNINHYHLKLHADQMVETDKDLLPTGKVLSVKGTSYDFTKGAQIGMRRLDTPFLCPKEMGPVAEISSSVSGIRMKVSSDQQAVVVYTPLDFAAICFETQNLPDGPNIPSFPSSLLRPGETYLNKAVFEFDLVT